MLFTLEIQERPLTSAPIWIRSRLSMNIDSLDPLIGVKISPYGIDFCGGSRQDPSQHHKAKDHKQPLPIAVGVFISSYAYRKGGTM